MKMIEQWAVRFLRSRGFVVMYLEDRVCRKLCWMKLYREQVTK